MLKYSSIYEHSLINSTHLVLQLLLYVLLVLLQRNRCPLPLLKLRSLPFEFHLLTRFPLLLTHLNLHLLSLSLLLYYPPYSTSLVLNVGTLEQMNNQINFMLRREELLFK